MHINQMIKLKLLIALIFLGFFSSSFADVYIQDFSPQGQVKTTNQVTATFSEDMVKLGDTDAVTPFTIDCAVKGTGRWTDTKTWRYQLKRDMQSGERCTFELKPQIKSLKQSNFNVENGQFPRYEVFTAGPWISRIQPNENSSIEENQHFFIESSAKVKPASVLKNAWCEVEGVGERIPVKLLSESEVQKLTTQLSEISAQSLGLYCQQKLPAGAKIKLVWGAGIESESGAKTLQDEEAVFNVRLPFKAELSCEREKPNAPCSALSDIKLLFSDQISIELAEKIQLVNQKVGAQLKVQFSRDVSPQRKKILITQNAKQYYLKNALINQNHLDTIVFKGPFKSDTTFNIQLPANFTDLSGRVLSNANSFPLKTKVGALPPLAKFSADFGILELKEGGVLPVTLRNVESKVAMRVLITNKPAEMLEIEDELNQFERQTKEITPNKAKLTQRSVEGYENEDYQPKIDYLYPRELSFLKDKPASNLPKLSPKQAFEVIGIPLQKTGFYVVEIESKLLGTALLSESKPLYVRTRALVTDMAVHFKKGGENSLIWVTSLSTGKPVAGADVTLYDCNNAPIWQAKTDAQGIALYEQELPEMRNCNSRYSYVATATKGNDFSFVRSDWQNGIEAWRFNVDTYSQIDSPKIHTILDRSLLRAGETVSMKHIARVPNFKGYAYPNAQNLKQALPDHITVELVGGEFTLDIPVEWDARGVATSAWKIPQDAGIGTYHIKIGAGWRETAQFKVSEFRLPAFKGSISPVKNNNLITVKQILNHINAAKIPFNLSLAYLNGGGASGQKVSVSALLTQAYPRFANYSEFSFSEQNPQTLNKLLADKISVTLDKQGLGKVDIPLSVVNQSKTASQLKETAQPAHLATEMTFNDPNGEIQTIHGSEEIWPANLVVGLQVKDWAGLKGTHKLQAVVLNTQGEPQANVAVKIEGTRHWEYVHRKRVIGGFYSYETDNNKERLGTLCEGKTNAQGFFNCQVTVKDSGDIQLQASVKDNQGGISLAGSGFYSSESGDIWFGQTDEDRMEVVPEKREYQPGEKARFQVHSPFYNATALIAVEREGILKTFVQPLQRKNSTIEIPIAENWGPNVFVSVLAVRGRLTEVPWYSFFQWGWRNPRDWVNLYKEGVPAPTAMVDLARPSFKFGLSKIAVGTSGFKLNVAVTTDKKTYQPRDKAKVTIQVKLPNGKPAPAGSEVVLAAVDKALLELNSNPTWALLDDMQQQRAYLMETASAQMQVIGKRHFGKKALPAGGGGGADLKARELFDTLIYWNPRVKLDKNGSATVSVPLNDSLTAFKLVAIADVNADLFGTGETEITAAQDLQMTSGLPPMMREGDSYKAMLTLRNTTQNQMQLRVKGTAGKQALVAQSITLNAGEAKELAWQLRVAEDASNLFASGMPWQIEAVDSKGKVQDRLRFTQKILPKIPATVQQANFMQLTQNYRVETGLPAGAIAGKGGLTVQLTAKLADQTAGIERYFNAYPYSCLEQKISIATGLQDKARWADIVSNLSSYQDSQGFLQYFPGMANGSEMLTAYVLTMAYENAVKLPAEVENNMQQALLNFIKGRSQPAGAWYWGKNQYLTERRLHALAALSYTGNVDTRVLTAFEFKPIQMPTTTLIDWLAIYKHLPKADNQAERMQQIDRELRNRLQNVGGRLIFTTEENDVWWWAMVDGEVNATRVVNLLMQNPAWQADMPALLRGAILRQNKGHWQTTPANAWGRLAMQKFGNVFEREAVTGVTTATLDSDKKQFDWANPSIPETKQPNQPVIKSKEALAAGLFFPWSNQGKPQQFSLQHAGTGKPWVNSLVTAAIPAKLLENGYKITRLITPIEQKVAGKWSRGDLLRVRLDIDSSQAMSWVALSDPIPAGASILGNTARDSAIAQTNENAYDGKNSVYPNYTERGLSFFRAYYEYAPKGHFWVEYTIRLNNPGIFNLPPTRIEAMYAPELFGQLPNEALTVQSAP